ncbi:hypothetical protein Hanom_Chr09g00763611 [Helianthus anomalus]
MVRDHVESDDGDYHEEEDANATQLASNAPAAPHGRSRKEVIFRVGMGLGNGKVHRAITMSFNECFDGAWSTYREVPTEHTPYSWDQANDEFIREGFENVLKRRFPDIMSDRRDESAKKARIAGHTIPENEYDFGVMCGQNRVEEMQQQMREDMQQQMAEFMKQFGNPSNPPL